MPLRTITLFAAAVGIATTLYRLGKRQALDVADWRANPDFEPPQSFDAAPSQSGRGLQDLTLAHAGTVSNANPDNQDLLTPPGGEDDAPETIHPPQPDVLRGA
jgi:hypothetical protein